MSARSSKKSAIYVSREDRVPYALLWSVCNEYRARARTASGREVSAVAARGACEGRAWDVGLLSVSCS